jgi:hypothetical protein
LRFSQGASFGLGNPKDITLEDGSDPWVLVSVV